MKDEKLYAVCVHESVVYDWGLVTFGGKPAAITKRRFVDIEVQRFRNDLGVLIEVGLKEFIADMKSGISESKFAKMLGWNYGQAAELVRAEGIVFIVSTGEQFESRPYSYSSARDDDEYALQLVRDLYSLSGGRFLLEEFDPVKHVLGYKPQIDT
ncbi:MAG: hypothetical protein LBE12_08775 [Planctomycetaceae bacterium]|jgi:hypothetical protein|nr:hypothetical protein [Planctomycetaceae bacterium]